MKVKNKNQTFQSCRFCPEGSSLFLIESDDGLERFYLCEKHRGINLDVKELPVDGIEAESFEISKVGFIQKAINYIKGG